MNPSHYLLLSLISLFCQLQTSNSQLVPLNSNCSYYKANMKCGTNAVCGAGDLCRCKFGYLPIGPSNIHCSAFKCSTSTDDCVRNFGPNTKCGHAKGNYCDCDFGNSSSSSDVFFDKQVQRCVHRHELTRIDCSSNANCGRGMFCDSGEKSCRCKYGYKLNRNGYDCDQISCSHDSDCKPPNWIEIIPRRRCSMLNKVCECTRDYELNEQTQECEWRGFPKPVTVKPEVKVRKDVKGNSGSVSGMQIFFIILVILLVIVACCICKAVSGKTTTTQYPRRHDRYDDCTNDYTSSSYNNTTELFTISSSSHDYSSSYQANDYSCTDNDNSTTHYNHEANDNSMPSYDDV